jgi:hypothetical protein
MEVYVTYEHTLNDHVIFGEVFVRVTVNSYLIDDVIKTWNSNEDRPRISRKTHFICDRFNNIYKDTDMFFVNANIIVYPKPAIGQPFFAFYANAPITFVRNENGEEITTNQALQGDCHIIFRTYEGRLFVGYIQDERLLQNIENARLWSLRQIKDANALGNKLNTLGRYAQEKQGDTFKGPNSIIAEMISGGVVRSVVPSVAPSVAYQEEGPICVIV